VTLAIRAASVVVSIVLLAPGGASHVAALPDVDMSHAPQSQDEVSITSAPGNPDILLAASNSLEEGAIRVYSSVDGGRTRLSRKGPPLPTEPAPAPRCVRTRFSCTSFRDGLDWTPPTAVASVPSDETQAAAFKGGVGREYGDYEGLTVAAGVAHPAWTDSRRLRTDGHDP
jgi:hypothetical protein